MKKQILIGKLKEMKFIAHRLGYQMTEYPENSMESLKTIFENKKLLDVCDGFEFDICFTKDNIPIVIHDKYIDDISDNCGLVKDYTLEEIKKIYLKPRKSIKSGSNSISYMIITLEEILTFFENNIVLLKNKILKIETKDFIFIEKNKSKSKNLAVLAEIINKFPNLHNNIVHLSYNPLNLSILKKIQNKNNQKTTKSELLCDYNFMVFLTKFMPYLDNISLRIKTNNLAKYDKNNSKRVNKKLKSNLFWMKFSNALKEKNLKYAINKYGSVGIYVLNTHEELDELCRHISYNFFKDNYRKIVITTNNPIHLYSIDKYANL